MKPKDIVSAWPDMHPPKAIWEQYHAAKNSGELQSFMQERMLRIASEEERMIPDHMIKWYTNRDLIIKNLDNFNLIITTDFTASNNLTGDFSGIAVWAINAIDERYLLDLWLRKSTINDQYEMLFKIVQKWKFLSRGKNIEVGVEIDGQQQLNIHTLDKMKIEKNIWFSYARQKDAPHNQVGIRSKRIAGSKLDRVKLTLGAFELGKWKFPEELKDTHDMQELLEELRKVTHYAIASKHDDGLDLLSQLEMIDYFLPSEIDTTNTSESLMSSDVLVWRDDFKLLDNDNLDDKDPLIF